MKKSSMIFKMICLAVAMILCLSVVPAFADDAAEDAATEEIVELVTEAVADEEAAEETVTEDPEAQEPVEEVTEDVAEDEVPEEEEVLDLFTATLRDGGVYVTPGNDNAAVFTHEGLRYKVPAGTGNVIKLDGFESNPTIESEPIEEDADGMLQANGEITTDAAHSGYFGLTVNKGDVVYRAAVTGGDIYVFSAWVRMPMSGSIDDNDRAFKVIGETGEEYIVGWNEIGREIDTTESWQQILFTFRAPETGLFQMDFNYRSRQSLAMDDLELYTAEIFDNPLEIRDITATDANGHVYATKTSNEGFSTSGTLTHKTVLYNSDEDDVFFTAVMILYKNDIMIDIETVEDCALVLDETEVTMEIEIPEDEDLSQYKYMVYFISDTTPTQFYGQVQEIFNPYVIEGN